MPRRSLMSVLAVLSIVLGMAAGSGAAPVTRQSYIVSLTPGAGNVPAVAAELAASVGGQLGLVYQHAIEGFSVTTTPAGAAALARHPRVARVSADEIVRIAVQDLPTGISRIFADADQTIDGSDDLRVDVDVAVLDTGVDFDHPDLNVDTAKSVNCSGGSPFKMSCGSGGDDDNGHGTHVAGTIGALDNDIGVVGVAPGARIWSVKVLRSDGSGYLSWIIAGIDYVTAHASEIEVANMSLGGSFSNADFDQALANSVAAGVAYAVAAGNSESDASGFSPANHPDVLTVSALADFNGLPGGGAAPTCRADEDDTFANFSNWGDKIEVIAPGVCILSTWPGGGYNTISGTSMASPHAAGALALLASNNNPGNGAEVRALYDTIEAKGNFNWDNSDDGDNVKEPLLDVSDPVFTPTTVPGSGGGGGTVNSPPTASFTYSCADLTCDFTDTSTDGDGTVTSWSWDFDGDGLEDSTAQNPSHTYGADGTYTVTVTVTDDDGAPDSDSQSVTVSSGDGGSTLTGESVNNGSTWTAIVTDASGAPLSGTWSYTGGSASCADNQCTLSGIPKRQGSVTFTASGGEQVTISKP